MYKVQDSGGVFFYNNATHQGILLTYGKHLHDVIITLRRKVYAH
jgi:hypothetical protein